MNKLTEIERCIIVINTMGVVLDEHDIETVLEEKCRKFAIKQCGIEKGRIVDAKRYNRYLSASKLGDSIWAETIEHFKKQNLKIDVVSFVESIYLMNENIILKHTTIKREDIDEYRKSHNNPDTEIVLNGTAIGGHLMGLMMRESGITINGKLRAIRLKLEDS